MHERLAVLLSKMLAEEATPNELRELEAWVIENPQDDYLIDIIKGYWYNHPAEDFAEVSDNANFQRIMGKIKMADTLSEEPTVVKLKRKKWWYTVAAVFIGLSIIASLFTYKQKYSLFKGTQNEVATSLGARSQIILPDGTKIWLNAATRLRYDKAFNDGTREVFLEGEAFFEVKKDKNRPFIVHTSAIDIRVIGTAFNVKSYKEERTIEATLLRGKIQVMGKLREGMPDIILEPNEKLVFTKDLGETKNMPSKNSSSAARNNTIYQVSKIFAVKNDTSFVETSWIHNRLLFEGDTFKALAVKMERWFDVEIEIKNTEVENYRLRGAFENESIEEALKALQEIANFNYKINGKKITITK